MSQFLFLASLLLSTENPCSQEKLLLIYGFETGLIAIIKDVLLLLLLLPVLL
jgi:hypothetical protein